MIRGAKRTPDVNSNEWKKFVANAISKPPSKRTKAEREAIAIAMAVQESEEHQKH